jgi:hypothetical protein
VLGYGSDTTTLRTGGLVTERIERFRYTTTLRTGGLVQTLTERFPYTTTLRTGGLVKELIELLPLRVPSAPVGSCGISQRVRYYQGCSTGNFNDFLKSLKSGGVVSWIHILYMGMPRNTNRQLLTYIVYSKSANLRSGCIMYTRKTNGTRSKILLSQQKFR